MNPIPIDFDSAHAAIVRLFDIARSDTGQARRVANFLLAWWNGPDNGHFEIVDLFGLDGAIAADITTVVGFLGPHPGAIYIDGLGFGDDIQAIIALRRNSAKSVAA